MEDIVYEIMAFEESIKDYLVSSSFYGSDLKRLLNNECFLKHASEEDIKKIKKAILVHKNTRNFIENVLHGKITDIVYKE